jgi:hypothetical protein
VARRYNPTIKEFYERLCARGKPKMVALVGKLRDAEAEPPRELRSRRSHGTH